MSQISMILNLLFENKGANPPLWESLKNIIQNQSHEIEPFCVLIKNKINNGNKFEILLSLHILDFSVDYGRLLLWEKIDNASFLECIINILKTKPDLDLHNTALFLIKKWAHKFNNYPSIKNCKNTYYLLKNSHIIFPNNLRYSYMNFISKNNIMNTNNNINNINFNNFNNNIYHTFTFGNANNNSNNYNNLINNNNLNVRNNNNINNNYNNSINEQQKKTLNRDDLRKSRIPSDPNDYIKNINLDLDPNNYKKKYRKLINKLNEWIILIQQINISIDNNVNIPNDIYLQKLCEDIKMGNDQLISEIQGTKLKDEKLMEISLNVSEDILMTLRRYEKLKKGENPGPFLTSFSRDNNPNNISNKNNNNFNNTLPEIEKDDFKYSDPIEKINKLGFDDTICTQYMDLDKSNNSDLNNLNNSNNNLSGLFDKINKTLKLDSSQNTDIDMENSFNNNNSIDFFTNMSNSGNLNIDFEKNNKNLVEILNDRNVHIFNSNIKDNNNLNMNNIVGNKNKFERIADNNDIKRLINNNNLYIGNRNEIGISKSQKLPSVFMKINDDRQIINEPLRNSSKYNLGKTAYNNI